MEEYEIGDMMNALGIAKKFYDHGKWGPFYSAAKGCLDEYDGCFWLAQESMPYVTEFVGDYENPIGDGDDGNLYTYYFCDPIIRKFFSLCEAYESQSGISPEENPYRQRIEDGVCRCVQRVEGFFCYLIRSKTHKLKGSGFVIIYDDEFYDFTGLLFAVFDILDCFKEKTAETERRLSELFPQKEAA